MNRGSFVGRHLIIDASVKEEVKSRLSSTNFLIEFLERLSEKLDMTLIFPPFAIRFPFAKSELQSFLERMRQDNIESKVLDEIESTLNRRENEAGCSAIAIWAESHASIHTWTEKNFLSIDVFSCKEFDSEKAKDFIIKEFGIGYAYILDIVRYSDSPQFVQTEMYSQSIGRMILYKN